MRRTISMRKIREILRLRFELGLGAKETARSVWVSHSTVLDVLRRFGDGGLSWTVPESMDDLALEQALYPVVEGSGRKPVPEWGEVHSELRREGVALHLFWLEYRTIDKYVRLTALQEKAFELLGVFYRL